MIQSKTFIEIYSAFIKDFGHSKQAHVVIDSCLDTDFILMEKKAIY